MSESDNTKLAILEPIHISRPPQSYFDLTDNHSVEIGSSLAYTPSVRIPGDATGAIEFSPVSI